MQPGDDVLKSGKSLAVSVENRIFAQRFKKYKL